MFAIHETKALVRSINPRAENHGDDTALACDIGLEFTVSNQELNMLENNLLACMYQRESGPNSESQDALDLEQDFLPHLRFPLLGKFPWNYEGVGYTFQLTNDKLNGEHITQLEACKVNNFQIECQEGGTIKLLVRVQGNPSEETIGELCHYIKSEVMVSLIPPEHPEQDGFMGDGEGDET